MNDKMRDEKMPLMLLEMCKDKARKIMERMSQDEADVDVNNFAEVMALSWIMVGEYEECKKKISKELQELLSDRRELSEMKEDLLDIFLNAVFLETVREFGQAKKSMH